MNSPYSIRLAAGAILIVDANDEPILELSTQTKHGVFLTGSQVEEHATKIVELLNQSKGQ